MMIPTPANRAELRTLCIWAAGVTVLTATFIVFWDVPLAWYFETQLHPDIHSTMGTITEAANGGIWYGLALLGLGFCLYQAKRSTETGADSPHARQARAWLFMLASMATAAALLNVSKLAIGRYRPRYLFNDDLSGFEPFGIALKMASFPSGHAQSIWSAMIALCFLTPRFAPLYILVAVTVSASRFVTAVHFVSDVIVGSFLSIAIAIVLRQWFERNGQSVCLSHHRTQPPI